MKRVDCDYGFLIDIAAVFGTLHTCTILGKDDSSEFLINKFRESVSSHFEDCKNNHKNNPIMKNLAENAIKVWIKDYKRIIKDCKKRKIPWWLYSLYQDIVGEVNNFLMDLNNNQKCKLKLLKA